MRFVKRHVQSFILLGGLLLLTGLLLVTMQGDRQVVFADANLEAAVRDALGKPLKPLYTSELNKIAELDASHRGIANLAGIAYLHNLTVLNLEGNFVSDVSPLRGLTQLRKLNLTNNGITDLEQANFTALQNIPLRQLNLDYNAVVKQSGQREWLTEIGVLRAFPLLEVLTLSENKIEDISGLASLTHLKTLVLEDNRIEDLSALANLTRLQHLNLARNEVRSIAPLSGLTRLTELRLNDNPQVTSVRPLAPLTQLKILVLDHVPVGEEVGVLADKQALEQLSLEHCQISDLSPLKNLTALKKLNLKENDVVDIAPLAGLTRLVELNLQSNVHLQSVAPLRNLTRLKKLDMQDVPVGAEMDVLAGMSQLVFLDVRNAGITDTAVLGALMAQGALQDHSQSGQTASIDLRDNPLQVTDSDAYQAIRPYWENVGERVPFVLPGYYPLAEPVFSVPSGFYDQSFALTLSTGLANVDIYYTLDGSEPTRESLRYTAPLMIQSREGAPNLYAEIADVSPRWMPPVGEVEKATVVRARVIDQNGEEHSRVVTHTFFVDAVQDTLPVISLVADPAYLFGKSHGIYVMGDIYDAFYDPASRLNPWEVEANYKQAGQIWERPIHIEYFDVQGALGFSQEASVRIHGAATRERGQKSLRLYANCEDGCEGTFKYPLFPGLRTTGTHAPLEEFTTFLLRNSGNDWESTMLRDALMQSLVEHTAVDIQAYQPAIVFLNGEYWGLHNLRERLDEYYLQSHYGIAPEDVVILAEKDLIIAGEEGDEQEYLQLVEFIATHDMAEPDNYAYIQTKMDVENFIDYQIFEIYLDNTNWPHVNIKYWRKKTAAYEPDAPYGQDGRWRWMLYDTDFGFGLDYGPKAVENDSLTNAINPDWNEWAGELLRSLLKNPAFREQFLSRFADHLNTSFAPQRVLEQIDRMEAGIQPEMEEHIRRWRGPDATLEDWHARVEVMRYFGAHRPAILQNQLVAYFGLRGTSVLHVETNPQRGYVEVNGIPLVAGTPGVVDPGAWTGVYFTGVPVETTAIPYPGFRFAGWEAVGGDALQSQTLYGELTGDLFLRAIFEEE